MKLQDPENEIMKLIEMAKSDIPKEMSVDLEADPLTKLPEWHFFEQQIWKNGEDIRQILLANKKLKEREDIFDRLLEIATDTKAKRGRQSFILLFGSVRHSKYAAALIEQINDEFVNGHVIDTIYRMKTDKYIREIEPFCTDKFAWIRNTAKKYVEKFKQQT